MNYSSALVFSLALGLLASFPSSGPQADERAGAHTRDAQLPPVLREGEAEFVPRPGDAEVLLYEPARPLAEHEPGQEPESAEEPLQGGISFSDPGADRGLIARADDAVDRSDEPGTQPGR